MFDHGTGLWRIMMTTKITTDPLFKVGGLTDIDNSHFFIEHTIDTGFTGQRASEGTMIYLLIIWALIGTWYTRKYFKEYKIFYGLSHYSYIVAQAESTISYCLLYTENIRNKEWKTLDKESADRHILVMQKDAEALLLQYKEAYPTSDKMLKLMLGKNHGEVPATR